MTNPFEGLFDLAIETYDKLASQAEIETPPEHPLACQAGCGSCCYQPTISVTAVEIFHIAHYVGEHFSEKEYAELLRRLEQPLFSVAFGGLPACPFLEEQNCSIYEARPFSCRSANSYDLSACESSVRQGRKGSNVPRYEGHLAATQLVLDALYKAIKNSGLENNLFDLRKAITVALKDPMSEAKWLDGKTVFGPETIAGQ